MSVRKCHLVISVTTQSLHVFDGEQEIRQYPIATAKNGIGQIEGSECTPLGRHQIAEKIGSQAPINAVFIGRQWQQEIYNETLAQSAPERDWILTRILWLDGLEPGLNAGLLANTSGPEVSCDTKSRYIYIHGCPDSHAMQIPSSHGCIKMRNADIIELYDMVDIETKVTIQLASVP